MEKWWVLFRLSDGVEGTRGPFASQMDAERHLAGLPLMEGDLAWTVKRWVPDE